MMRNCEVILAFLVAYTVAAFSYHNGERFVDAKAIHDSPSATFFWVHTFKLGMLASSPVLTSVRDPYLQRCWLRWLICGVRIYRVVLMWL